MIKLGAAYQQALIKYSDRNKDGVTSPCEEDDFSKRLLLDKKATLISSEKLTKAQIGLLTDWIRNYKPSK